MLPRLIAPRVALLLMLASVGGVPVAHAGLLYDNSGQTPSAPNYGDPISSSLYDSFSTGPQGVLLTSVRLLLFGTSATATDGGQITALVFSDSGTSPFLPVASLGTFSDSLVTSTNGLVPTSITLTPIVPTSLAPNSRYWVNLADSGATTVTTALWAYDGSNAGFGVSTEFNYNSLNGSISDNSGGAYLMQVSAVPEPGSFMLLAGGLFGFLLVRRARSKKV